MKVTAADRGTRRGSEEILYRLGHSGDEIVDLLSRWFKDTRVDSSHPDAYFQNFEEELESSTNSAASWATMRRSQPTSSPSAASATA